MRTQQRPGLCQRLSAASPGPRLLQAEAGPAAARQPPLSQLGDRQQLKLPPQPHRKIHGSVRTIHANASQVAVATVAEQKGAEHVPPLSHKLACPSARAAPAGPQVGLLAAPTSGCPHSPCAPKPPRKSRREAGAKVKGGSATICINICVSGSD